MKEVITTYELSIVDSLAVTADALARAIDDTRLAQERLVEGLVKLLLVDEWDAHKRDEIELYIREGGPQSIEKFLERLGVGVHDPLAGGQG
jgi:hypothetical protein